jgi:hypothetical protein
MAQSSDCALRPCGMMQVVTGLSKSRTVKKFLQVWRTSHLDERGGSNFPSSARNPVGKTNEGISGEFPLRPSAVQVGAGYPI